MCKLEFLLASQCKRYQHQSCLQLVSLLGSFLYLGILLTESRVIPLFVVIAFILPLQYCVASPTEHYCHVAGSHCGGSCQFFEGQKVVEQAAQSS